MDPVRVLADLSGLVVEKLVGDDDRANDDPFGRAVRRYQQEGAPAPAAAWRRALSTAGVRSERAATVLKRLTRDLLTGISASHERAPNVDEAAEAPPENVRSIADATAQVPGFELASDGRWKPAAPSEEDLLRGSRARGPRLGSRYPEV